MFVKGIKETSLHTKKSPICPRFITVISTVVTKITYVVLRDTFPIVTLKHSKLSTCCRFPLPLLFLKENRLRWTKYNIVFDSFGRG